MLHVAHLNKEHHHVLQISASSGQVIDDRKLNIGKIESHYKPDTTPANKVTVHKEASSLTLSNDHTLCIDRVDGALRAFGYGPKRGSKKMVSLPPAPVEEETTTNLVRRQLYLC